MGFHAVAGFSHARRLVNGEIDEDRASEVQHREQIEIRSKPELVGDSCRDDAADQIARNIARDVCGESGAGVGRAALLAKIGECQREG